MRLLDDMAAHVTVLEGQAHGFRLTGEATLAVTARAAARALREAIAATEQHHARLGEALNAAKEA